LQQVRQDPRIALVNVSPGQEVSESLLSALVKPASTKYGNRLSICLATTVTVSRVIGFEGKLSDTRAVNAELKTKGLLMLIG